MAVVLDRVRTRADDRSGTPAVVEHVGGPPPRRAPRDHDPAVGRQAPRNMFSATSSSGHSVRFLEDDADAGGEPGRHVAGRQRGAVDADLAVVGRLVAGQDPHQRRLAGAVLADQADDLARVDVEVDAAQGGDAAEVA